eukprot:m.707909 g.707909  ORF g.707909 m.707909 type:complete len:50 (+) comp22937_c1_seq6:1069-1218(+)
MDSKIGRFTVFVGEDGTSNRVHDDFLHNFDMPAPQTANTEVTHRKFMES